MSGLWVVLLGLVPTCAASAQVSVELVDEVVVPARGDAEFRFGLSGCAGLLAVGGGGS